MLDPWNFRSEALCSAAVLCRFKSFREQMLEEDTPVDAWQRPPTLGGMG